MRVTPHHWGNEGTEMAMAGMAAIRDRLRSQAVPTTADSREEVKTDWNLASFASGSIHGLRLLTPSATAKSKLKPGRGPGKVGSLGESPIIAVANGRLLLEP